MKLLGSRTTKVVLALGLWAAVLGMPSVASAAILTYTPPGPNGIADNDLNDLDHYYMYAWKIQDKLGSPSPDTATSVFTGASVTGAVLTFTNLYNWQAEPNALYITLLDTAYNIGTNGTVGWNNPYTDDLNQVTYTQDITGGTTSNQISNGFVNPANGTVPTVANSLVSSTTDREFLTAQSFPSQYGNFALPSATYAVTDPYVNDSTLGVGWAKVVGDSSAPFSYTYTFSADQLATLNDYIYRSTSQTANPYDFALGFDPDCHFLNDGVSLTLTTSSLGTTSAVPEPSSLLLFGTGLVMVGRRYRKNRQR